MRERDDKGVDMKTLYHNVVGENRVLYLIHRIEYEATYFFGFNERFNIAHDFMFIDDGHDNLIISDSTFSPNFYYTFKIILAVCERNLSLFTSLSSVLILKFTRCCRCSSRKHKYK